MPTGDRQDPYAAFNFILDVDGITAVFSEVTGVNTESDLIEYRTGESDITVTKIPGLKKFGNISLKRGMTQDLALWEWRKTVLDGMTERKAGSITLLNEAREPVLRWNFREAWPTKWDAPSFNATGNEIAIETLEIACEGLDLEKA
jgi:phage tail-like protein